MNEAFRICAPPIGGAPDLTGGAQYFSAAGQPHDWMPAQIQNGNCVKVNFPKCKVLEFYKCKKPPLK